MNRQTFQPCTTGIVLLVFAIAAAGVAAGACRKSQQEREQVSPACHPTFGYHQTCWRRFPALPPCDPAPCDSCPACRTGSVNAGLPDIPPTGIEFESRQPWHDGPPAAPQAVPQPTQPEMPALEGPEPAPTSDILPPPDMSAGSRYRHSFHHDAAASVPAARMQPGGFGSPGNRYGSAPTGAPLLSRPAGPAAERRIPDGYQSNMSSSVQAPLRSGNGRYGLAAWNRPRTHALRPATRSAVQKLTPIGTGAARPHHSAVGQTLRYPGPTAAPPVPFGSDTADQRAVATPAAPVLRLPGS